MPAHTDKHFSLTNRRAFLKAGLITGAGALFAARFARAAEPNAAPGTPAAPQPPAAPSAAPSKVALTNGDNRTDNIFRALKSLEKEIAQSIGNRRVVIKPNNVSPTNQLAATHADALTGILEFLKSIGKLDNAIIAESAAFASTMQGFDNFGYTKLADKYKVKLVDLDKEKFQTVMAFNQSDAKPHPVRVSSILANQEDNFIISACMLKTHDQAVATMSIKNIVLGAPLKLPNPNAGGGRGGRTVSDKPTSTAAARTASTSIWRCWRRCCTRRSPSLTGFKACKATARLMAPPWIIASASSAPITSPPTPLAPA